MPPEQVLARVFGVSPSEIGDDSANTTLSGWDSMGHVTLVLELESTYKVSLSAEEVFGMTNVAAIKRVLTQHGVSW